MKKRIAPALATLAGITLVLVAVAQEPPAPGEPPPTQSPPNPTSPQPHNPPPSASPALRRVPPTGPALPAGVRPLPAPVAAPPLNASGPAFGSSAPAGQLPPGPQLGDTRSSPRSPTQPPAFPGPTPPAGAPARPDNAPPGVQPAGFEQFGSSPSAAPPGNFPFRPALDPHAPPNPPGDPIKRLQSLGSPPTNQPSPLGGVQSPALSVAKFGPQQANVGQPVVYEIVVANKGSAAVQDVVVRDEVPAGCDLVKTEPKAEMDGAHLRWALGTLEPQTEKRFTVELTPREEGDLNSQAAVTFSAVTAARTSITRPQLLLKKVGPQEALVGDPVTFRLTVTNPGSGSATNVMIRENLPAGLEHPDGKELEYPVGTLAPGATRELELTLNAARAGHIVNRAVATADGNLESSAEAALDVHQPMLALTKTGPARRYLDREATYTVAVTNPGNAPATSVLVVDTIPTGFEFNQAAAQGQWNQTRREVTWAVGDLKPGETKNVTVSLQAVHPGQFTHRARASADRGLTAEGEVGTLVEGVPGLLLEVIDLEDPIEVGAKTTYEIRVVNQGTKSAGNIQIVADVPKGLQPLSADGPAKYEIRGQQIVFSPVEKLAPRADATYRLYVRGTDPGDLRLKVRLTANTLSEPVNEEEATRVYTDQ